MMFLIIFSAPSFFRHQKDSGVWSIYKGKNLSLENHILDTKLKWTAIRTILATFLGITQRCLMGASFCYIINRSYSVDVEQFLVHYIAAKEKQLTHWSEQEFWLTTLTSTLAQLSVVSLFYPPLVLQNLRQGIQNWFEPIMRQNHISWWDLRFLLCSTTS